ncbi:hypothetical protein RDWZM_003689 [Blomia tropicalis]|uniref:Uncharacterized protein n=1 Tax=Blomia tropicalis TaxID=40697 RepID=A0A9Q0RSS6_BLOTA|nr:hypothetical protein RDWZM_003689 [Blomia tropicalis]
MAIDLASTIVNNGTSIDATFNDNLNTNHRTLITTTDKIRKSITLGSSGNLQLTKLWLHRQIGRQGWNGKAQSVKVTHTNGNAKYGKTTLNENNKNQHMSNGNGSKNDGKTFDDCDHDKPDKYQHSNGNHSIRNISSVKTNRSETERKNGANTNGYVEKRKLENGDQNGVTCPSPMLTNGNQANEPIVNLNLDDERLKESSENDCCDHLRSLCSNTNADVNGHSRHHVPLINNNGKPSLNVGGPLQQCVSFKGDHDSIVPVHSLTNEEILESLRQVVRISTKMDLTKRASIDEVYDLLDCRIKSIETPANQEMEVEKERNIATNHRPDVSSSSSSSSTNGHHCSGPTTPSDISRLSSSQRNVTNGL